MGSNNSRKAEKQMLEMSREIAEKAARIRELEAELAARDNCANEVLRILREATGKRDFHSEMEAAEWAAKALAEAQTQEKIAQRLADLSAGRELEAVQRAAELEAQLADARRDSARLDWLICASHDGTSDYLSDAIWDDASKFYFDDKSTAECVRAAIDAAMGGE